MRPGNVLVAVRNPNRLQHLERILRKTDTRKMDIVVLSVRTSRQAPASTAWNADQIFSDAETRSSPRWSRWRRRPASTWN